MWFKANNYHYRNKFSKIQTNLEKLTVYSRLRYQSLGLH
jgi:hypothetical protein